MEMVIKNVLEKIFEQVDDIIEKVLSGRQLGELSAASKIHKAWWGRASKW